MTEPRFIPPSEVKVLVERVLAEAFPTTPFFIGVEFHDNSWVAVNWSDGPSHVAVHRFVRLFEGKHDGELVQHIFEGEDVQFGSNYIHLSRHLSPELLARAESELEQLRYGDPEKFEAFLKSINYSGSIDRDIGYLERQFARTVGDVEAGPSVLATAMLLANPFLFKEQS